MYPSDILNKIWYIEVCAGVAFGMGPFIGAVVYDTLKYQGTLYLFAFINAFGLLISYKYIPNQCNQTVQPQKEQIEDN